jgi:hypothetical protein
VSSFGNKALLVIGKNRERGAKVLDLLEKSKVVAIMFGIGEEPTTELAGKIKIV